MIWLKLQGDKRCSIIMRKEHLEKRQRKFGKVKGGKSDHFVLSRGGGKNEKRKKDVYTCREGEKGGAE